MASPEDARTTTGGDLGSIGHDVAPAGDKLPSAEPFALPLVDYRLISVPAEAERREKFLSTVTVDENGVAHAVNASSQQETLLAAVRIDDEKNATQVPLVVNEGGILLFELADDKPSRIGFFVGHKTPQDVAGVLRMGLYPGVPLTTQSVNDKQTKEIMHGIKGLNASETDEATWADQIGLFAKLGFDPSMSRGIFNKDHNPSPYSNMWQARPLVVAPDEIRDAMLAHYSKDDVRKDEFQILFYGVRQQYEHFYAYRRQDTLGRESDTLGLKSMRSTRGIGIGFGEARSRQATTKGVEVVSLEGAFNIKVVPTSA